MPVSFETCVSLTSQSFYKCIIKNKKNFLEDSTINLTGQHEKDKTINDVNYVLFAYCSMKKIPKGLSKIFPNMKVLHIYASKLQTISKSDLYEYRHLERFYSEQNEHEYLSGDLFEGFDNLRWISFYESKLNIIEPDILDGLDKLQYVNIKGTTKFDCLYSIFPINVPNSTLDEVKIELLKKFLSFDPQIIRAYLNRIKYLPKNDLLSDLRAFIEDDSSKDLKIRIDDRDFHVHKLLLMIRSLPMAEILRNNPDTSNINLVDIPVDIFEVILKFIYTDELPENDNLNFMQLFVASNRLQIKKLKSFAAEKISTQINEDNAVDILNMSNKYNQEELRHKSFEEIKKMYPKIQFKDEWALNPEKVLKFIAGFEKMEKEMKKLKDEFEKLMTGDD